MVKLTTTNLSGFVYEVLKRMEGAKSLYDPSAAGGNSGLSFGYMQNDVTSHSVLSTGYSAYTLLQKALQDYGISSSEISTIMAKADTPGIQESNFSPNEWSSISNALQNDSALVQAQDLAQAQLITDYINQTINSATGWPYGSGVLDPNNLDPTAIALLASWYNRTGEPTNITDPNYPDSLPNTESPTGLSVDNIINYLMKQSQFTTRGENFGNWYKRIESAVNKAETSVFGHLLDVLSYLFFVPNSAWAAAFNAPRRASPIILDLDGDGVATISKNEGSYFDLNNNGFAEKTGWVSATDGILVWDRDSNGTIDNGSELFGNNALKQDGVTIATDGYDLLQSYDGNSDGKIDASDALWQNLKLWVDADQDGITDDGELHSLSEYNVQSISTVATSNPDATDAAGNHPTLTSTYTKTDNTTAATADVFFETEPSDSVILDWVETTAAIDALPDLAGGGNLYTLHQAMAHDTSGTLQALVEQFVNATTVAARNSALESIILQWADAQNVDPNSRNHNGATINAKHLVVLEAFMGKDFVQPNATQYVNDPLPGAGTELTNSYNFLFERLYAQLAAQTFMESIYEKISIVSDTSGVHFDFTDALADVFDTSRPTEERHTYITEFYRTIFASGISSDTVDYDGLKTYLATNASQYVSEVNSLLQPYYAGVTYWTPSDAATITGTLGNDTINGSAGNDTLSGELGNDTIYGNAGDDILYGNAGDDIVHGGTGTNTMYGGTGADTIYTEGTADVVNAGAGDDTIYVSTSTLGAGSIDGGAGDDTIKLYLSRDISAATISNVETLNLGVYTATMSGGQLTGIGTITAGSTTSTGTITAASAGTYDLSGKTTVGNIKINGSSGDDVIKGSSTTTYIYGNAGNDTIYAGDNGEILYGGAGTNTMYGGSGNDTIYTEGTADVVNAGAGDDTIQIDYSTLSSGGSIDGGDGDDTIRLIVSRDISGATISNVETLNLNRNTATMSASQLASIGTITAGGEAYTGTITAASAGTYDLSGKTITGRINLTGSSGNDIIKGSSTTTYIYGNAGNDTIYAGNNGETIYSGSGTNTMYGGSGNDTIYTEGTADVVNAGAGDDTIYVSTSTLGAGSIDGGAGDDTIKLYLSRDISGATISNVETLNLNRNTATMSASQLASIGTITAGGEAYTGTITAASAGTYDLSGKTITGRINLTGSSGNDVLIGDASAQTITGNAGNDTLDGKGGADTLNGGTGNDTYIFGLGYGADSITDCDSTSGNTDILSFGSGITSENLWFSQSGNDLLVNVIGSSDSVTIKNWYSSASYDLEEFTTTDGYELDSQLAQLVSAMASYATNNPGFDPVTATSMPTDSTLQSAIAASWHT